MQNCFDSNAIGDANDMRASPDVQSHAGIMADLDMGVGVMARLCGRHEREPD